MKASAIIVTRGDVDLAPIIGQEWPDAVDEIVIWDNSKDENLAVYGRYAAIEKAKNPLIYVQDDDCVVSDPQAIVGKHQSLWEGRIADPNDVVVCNMPPEFRHEFYTEHALVGFGACFHRDAPGRAFSRFGETWPLVGEEDFFDRTCDIVFTALTPRVLVDVPYENLPWAEAENRMWKQPTHVEERMRMLELVRRVRGED